MMMAKHAETDERIMDMDAGGTDTKGMDTGVVELVDRARAGDRTAFNRLADRFQRQIYQMIYYRIQSQMDAEDITQDVLLQAFRNIRRLKSSVVFRGWLYRIAVNRIRDFYRRKKFKSLFGFVSMDQDTFQETEELAEAPEASKHLERRDFWRQIEYSLAPLSRMEREVFLLRFFDELSIKEMSDALGKNESTVKTHLYRALRKVKDAASKMDILLEGLS